MALRVKGTKKAEAMAAAWSAMLFKDNPVPLENLLKNLLTSGLDTDPESQNSLKEALHHVFGNLATTFSDIIEQDLESLGNIRPGEAKDEFRKAMNDAFGFGVGAHFVAVVAELFMPLKALGIPTIAALLAEFSGFKELVGAYHGPLVQHAIRIPSSAEHAAKFRSTPPPGQVAAQWRARRLIADTAADDPIAWSGLMPDFQDAEKAAAYSAVQPRALATLYQDVPFPTAQVQSMLEFHGIRPQDVSVLLDGMQQASIKNVRNSYLASIVQAWERGDITDTEAFDDLQDLNFSQEAIHMVELTVANRKLVQLSELYRRSIDIAYQAGLITDAEYIPQLEAIGIAEADANAHYAIASFTKQRKILAQEEREAAAAARTLIRSSSNAAIADFQAGSINATELAALLASAGMAPLLIPSVVAYQVARQNGRLRLTFGKLLKPADAAILRSQVVDVLERVTKKIVAPQQALVVLEGLGLNQATAAPLVGKAAAAAGINWP